MKWDSKDAKEREEKFKNKISEFFKLEEERKLKRKEKFL